MPKLLIIFVSVCLLQIFAAQKLNEPCTTGDNQPGVCRLFSKCNPLKKVNYIPDNICDTDGNEEVVCCKLLPEPVTECGTIVPDFNKLNEKQSEIFEHPWTVIIYSNQTARCVGSLINSRYVLNPAHCSRTWQMRNETVMVKLGVWNITAYRECSENGVECVDHLIVGIEKTIIHEHYSLSIKKYDIALTRLNAEIQFTNFVRPICLPPETIVEPALSKATAVGWSKYINKTIIDWKIQMELTIMDTNQCALLYSDMKQNIDDSQICASISNQSIYCASYIGGPLIATYIDHENNKSYYYVVGIASYGPTVCTFVNIPEIYTNVNMYLPWIKSKILP